MASQKKRDRDREIFTLRSIIDSLRGSHTDWSALVSQTTSQTWLYGRLTKSILQIWDPEQWGVWNTLWMVHVDLTALLFTSLWTTGNGHSTQMLIFYLLGNFGAFIIYPFWTYHIASPSTTRFGHCLHPNDQLYLLKFTHPFLCSRIFTGPPSASSMSPLIIGPLPTFPSCLAWSFLLTAL